MLWTLIILSLFIAYLVVSFIIAQIYAYNKFAISGVRN